MRRSTFARVCHVLLALSLLLTAPHAALAEPVYLLLLLDDSGSTLRQHRFERERAAARRLVEAQPLSGETTVALAVASDRVEPRGAFVLETEADRTRLLRAIDALNAMRSTSTRFAEVDREVAALLAREVRPHQQFGMVFFTDAIPDVPESDLRAEDLADQVIPLGEHTFAMVAGFVPEAGHLTSPPRACGSQPCDLRRSGGASSLRALLTPPAVDVEGPRSVDVQPDAGLWGGVGPSRFTVRATNRSTLARDVRLSATAPTGVRIRFSPEVQSVSPGDTRVFTVEIEPTSRQLVAGALQIRADVPGSRAGTWRASLRVAPRSWFRTHWFAIACMGLTCVIAALLYRGAGRRPLTVGVPGTRRSAALRVGDAVPLSTFAPQLASGVAALIRTRWGLRVRAIGSDVRIGERAVPHGSSAPYTLREALRVGDVTFVLDLISPDEPRRPHAVTPLAAGTFHARRLR